MLTKVSLYPKNIDKEEIAKRMLNIKMTCKDENGQTYILGRLAK
ncbi:MAG: hypothetical protein PHE49_07425 [bacterium]|nr:hypothetical protein [bacterium]